MLPARQLRAIWPTLSHLLHIGKPSVVLRLRVEGTPEFDERLVGVVKNWVCRRTSSRTNFCIWPESCLRRDGEGCCR